MLRIAGGGPYRDRKPGRHDHSQRRAVRDRDGGGQQDLIPRGQGYRSHGLVSKMPPSPASSSYNSCLHSFVGVKDCESRSDPWHVQGLTYFILHGVVDKRASSLMITVASGLVGEDELAREKFREEWHRNAEPD